MSPGLKILVFFPIWFLFLGLFYIVVFIIYPESLFGSKVELDELYTTNLVFLLISQLAIFFGTFSAIFFVSKFIDKQAPSFLKSLIEPIGSLIGILLGIFEIFLIILIYLSIYDFEISFNGIGIELIWYLILFILVAISEESMSRGFIFTTLYKTSNKYLAIILSSVIFSALHIFNSNIEIIGIINTILAGIFFCQLYLIKMNLSIPIGYHFSWNFFQGPILGFPVSGLEMGSIFQINNTPVNYTESSNYGLEGSLISTIISINFIILLFIIHTRKKLNQ